MVKDMRKLILGEPVVISQSTTAPVFRGGHQDPKIREKDGVLYVKFYSRRDCFQDHGKNDANPTYRSVDEGKTWELATNEEWVAAGLRLPNGDVFQFRDRPIIQGYPTLPELDESRKNYKTCANQGEVYTVEELKPVLGDRIHKNFIAYRIKAGTTELVTEEGPIHRDQFPVRHLQDFLARVDITNNFKIDKNGTVWCFGMGPLVDPDGKMTCHHDCIHLYRSDDLCHSFTYVSTVVYKPEYNVPNAKDVEGFHEAAFDILDDGTFFMILRSGSLHPFDHSDDDHPAPKMFTVRSTDQGKTWSTPEVFYDYGVLPRMVKLGCGTRIMVSGRPGVYLRSCDDPEAREWSDIIPILTVPKEDVYHAYYQYTSSNCDLVAYDDHTAFLTYDDFKLTTPDGERAKSIVVRKITVVEE